MLNAGLIALSFLGPKSTGFADEAESRTENAAVRSSPLSPASKENYRDYGMTHGGNPDRGRALFNAQRSACVLCHALDDGTRKAGPNLQVIGDKLGRGDIIESILWPSRSIADGYGTTVLETRAGETLMGIVSDATDSQVEVTGVDGRPKRLAKTEIHSRTASEMSLMPEGLYADLSHQDFTDLVEYLVSLKQEASLAAFHAGTPTEIPSTANPVILRSFHDKKLQFESPVWFGQVPGNANAFLVLEHASGRIWLLEKDSEGDGKTLFLDLGLSSGEGARGLMGLAFHPQFRENGRYFLALHIVEKGQHIALTVEREAAPDLRADSGNDSRIILRMEATTSSHTGGELVFGADGYLYVGMGDTGPHGDPNGHAQNMGLLKGKMLRLDVDRVEAGLPYAIPPDNPFVGQSGIRPEIWVSGLREPWRFSFDPLTNDLWVGDVGQDRYEEVAIIRRGENHGWNVWEGFDRFSNEFRRENTAFAKPVFAYPRKRGNCIIGGHVYRADPQSTFYGVYVFGDHSSRRIWGLTQSDRHLEKVLEIGASPQKIVSFGRSENGDLFLVGYEGTIFQIDFSSAVFAE